MSTTYISFSHRVILLVVALIMQLPALSQIYIDPSFPPLQVAINQERGSIIDVVRQEDGKYIIGGSFTSINGVPALRLARLESNGSVDVAFTNACQANGTVTSLALQPDGRILVGGYFSSLAGVQRTYIGRLESSGILDASFAPYVSPVSSSGVNKIVVQPDGQILLSGKFNLRGPTYADQLIVRLSSTGQYDTSFQFTQPTPGTYPRTIVLQPNGHVLVGGDGPSFERVFVLMRLLPNGAIDTNFSVLNSLRSTMNEVRIDAAGRIYAAGKFLNNGTGNTLLRRYLPNGAIDPTFNYPRSADPADVSDIKAIALQPDGKVLVAHLQGVERLLSDGNFDSSFMTNIGGVIYRFLVQSDGAIMVAGNGIYPSAGTRGTIGLVRILDSTVLRLQSSSIESRTAIWPVPAHDVLNLKLDAVSQPQHVQLLDALGRSLLIVEKPTNNLILPLDKLPAGMYLVQVQYANGGQVMRRIAVNH